ncbi:hypothetical protein KHQ81_00895 [Mycoplasmatota bacterium]|nr:hypothetical protein KHQ81_00895 [Mycoplasmatota bacterium]
MEKLINNNDHVIKKAFNNNVMFTAAFITGPVIMTIITVLNMHKLKVKKTKQLVLLIIGIIFCLLYLYAFTLDNSKYVFLTMFATGSIIYWIYNLLARMDIIIFEKLTPKTNVLEVSINKYYYMALLLHFVIRRLAGALL